MDYVQYLYTEDKEKKKIMGTLATLGIDLDILNPRKTSYHLIPYAQPGQSIWPHHYGNDGQRS